jgi:hypothetical protein
MGYFYAETYLLPISPFLTIGAFSWCVKIGFGYTSSDLGCIFGFSCATDFTASFTVVELTSKLLILATIPLPTGLRFPTMVVTWVADSTEICEITDGEEGFEIEGDTMEDD